MFGRKNKIKEIYKVLSNLRSSSYENRWEEDLTLTENLRRVGISEKNFNFLVNMGIITYISEYSEYQHTILHKIKLTGKGTDLHDFLKIITLW